MDNKYPTYRPHPFQYRERVENLCKLIPLDRCMIVLKSFPVQYMSNDIDYVYRPSTDIIYLCGFPEPESGLVIFKDYTTINTCLYVREKCPDKEVWTGKYFGLEGTEKFFSIDSTKNIETLDHDIINYTGIIYNQDDIKLYIQQLRLVKDKDEIKLMRISCQISGRAHIKSMIYSYKQYTKKGDVPEQKIDARLTYEMTKSGCRRLAYPNVVAAGENATCLHYDAYTSDAKEGDLVLVDAGGEYKYYASDITRTWPISGKFSKEQAQIYNIVLKANKECIDMTKPGTTIQHIHDHSKTVIKNSLVELGLLNDDQDIKRFYMHNVGHWIGIDVHDCLETDRWNVILKPGHCFTIEPGIYISSDDDIPIEYRNIGIRIEDDIVITSDGCEVLSHDVPKEIEDLNKIFDQI